MDSGLRMDGLLAVDLWDIVIEVLRSTNNTARQSELAQGNLCGTGDHSINKNKTKISTEKSKREVEKLSNVDYVPTNAHSSQGESRLYIFEDNEAVIKMTVKGRSPTMRHVSRTHRVALDWLFDRITLERKIRIKYVDTKNQLADMLTKESFTRDEWNHLLRLFNMMSFPMFSCSHFSNFLCDPIGKQSAVSKRGQEAISSEGSPVAKPTPMILAKAKPVNFVLRSPWSTRENRSQNLGHPVDPGNVDEGQGSQTNTRKLVQTTQSPEVEYSQVRRQKRSSKFKSLETGQRKKKKTHCTDSDSKNRVSKFEVHKPSIHDEGLPFPKKEIGDNSRTLNNVDGSIEDKCVEMGNVHVFVNESSHSSWTELFGEFGDPQEHELRGNSELIQYHTETDLGAF